MDTTKTASIINWYHARVENLRTEDLLFSEHISRLAEIDLDLSERMDIARVTTEEDDYITDKTYEFSYNDGWLYNLEVNPVVEIHGFVF